jgi:hypothetical protein
MPSLTERERASILSLLILVFVRFLENHPEIVILRSLQTSNHR